MGKKIMLLVMCLMLLLPGAGLANTGTSGSAETPAADIQAAEPTASEPQTTETPAPEAPASEAPATDSQGTETPAAQTPTTETPATEATANETPTSETPATEAPANETPTTETPATEAPATETPAAETPAANETQTADVQAVDPRAADTQAVGPNVDDFTPPVIEDFQITPATAMPGETITFTATVTDELNAVGGVDVFLNSPSGQFRYVFLSQDVTTGKWIGSYIVQSNDENGPWTADVSAWDANFNTAFLDPVAFTIDNVGSDFTPPAVENLQISTLTASPTDVINFEATVSDQTGIQSVSVWLTSESLQFREVPLTLNTTTGKWEGSYQVQANDENGPWTVEVYVEDTAGNYTWHLQESKITINNTAGDFTAPTVESVAATPAEVGLGEDVIITATVTDAQSGVNSVAAFLRGPSGTGLYVDLAYNTGTQKWVGTHTISLRDEAGAWTVAELDVSDNAGNRSFEAITGTNFTVINPNADSTAPSFESIAISPQTAKAGGNVTITVKAQDDKSGMEAVDVSLIHEATGGLEFVTLAYNAAANEWTGTFPVQATTFLGVWKVDSILLTDIAGNSTLAFATASFTVVDPDTTPPANPVVNPVTDKDTAVTGQAEAGSKVEVKAGSTVLGTATTAANGQFSVTIPAQTAGTQLSVTAADAAGNVSEAAAVVVTDATAPAKPVVNGVTDKDTSVTGQAEAGSKIEVKAGSAVLGTATAGTDGSFTVTIPVQKAGTELAVTAADATGNASAATTVVVSDATAPGKPVVNKVTDKDTSVTGQAEAGAKVEVKAGSNVLGTGTAGTDGSFTVTIPAQKAGTELTVIATDTTGNVSEATIVVVSDSTAPAQPVVNGVTDKDTSVTGQAEAGSKIEVKAGSTVLGTATAGTDGSFTVTIPVQKAGTEIAVTAADATGNASAATTVVVSDATAPAAPQVNRVTERDTVITGKAEPGAVVTVSAGWITLGSALVKADGSFTVAISALKSGTTLKITVTDQAGNTSGAITIQVVKALSGWVLEGGKWYYYDPVSFTLKTGWYKVGGTWYYSNANGVMQTDWVKWNNKWYYLKSSGAMATGWLLWNNKWYYLQGSGAMATGWVQWRTKWYYMHNTSGAMLTNSWVTYRNNWYYLDSNGVMVTGWKRIAGKLYYFFPSGALRR